MKYLARIKAKGLVEALNLHSAELTGVVLVQSFSKLQRRIRSELPKCLLIFPRAHHANYFLLWTKLYLSTKVMQTIVHNISWFTCCGFWRKCNRRFGVLIVWLYLNVSLDSSYRNSVMIQFFFWVTRHDSVVFFVTLICAGAEKTVCGLCSVASLLPQTASILLVKLFICNKWL